MKVKSLKIGNVVIGGKELAFILGPCVIESEKFVWRMARTDRRNLREGIGAIYFQSIVRQSESDFGAFVIAESVRAKDANFWPRSGRN